jgi:rare lipoprotein A
MGTRFKPKSYTAAHKTLPLPSKVRVTNLHNGRSVIVLVNDRGPFKKNRLIDLSQGAAKKIGVHGVANVKIESIGNLADND